MYASFHGVDYAALIIRVTLAIPMFMHGYNHLFGGGKLAGTGRWFESLGMKPGWLHARFATFTELGVAPLLILGLLTPLAAAGVIGVMLVALITNHYKNGYFIFRPGEGYEYVLFITMSSFGLAALGGGKFSLDNAFNIGSWMYGGKGLLVSLLGVLGAIGLLAVFWRPVKPAEGS
ncbi:MAG TPA: DoxX family protein [Mycobacteriales bacterium]|jgi:putative oxidoreductase|nr:DoxX family protein [Mycobacteriales bacterium]